MLIGIPKEIKNHEYRVGLVPASVAELVANGHEVVVETQAGCGIGFTDDDYKKVGAKIAKLARDIFAKADMVVKVKEPQPVECRMLRPDQILFTYLHLAPDPEQTQLLQDANCAAIAYETITDDAGGLPLLAPMSAVAGRMAAQAGAHSLEKAQGGSGVLLGGVEGVAPGKVVVIGGGVVGTNALQIALGMGANVTVLDKSAKRLADLQQQFGDTLKTIEATPDSLESAVIDSDLVIGAVLVPGGAAPKLVTRAMLQRMRPGSVLVDVAIDQGGCFETSRPTTHEQPIYIEEDIVHYCVTNMPGAVPRTATFALNNATLPHVIALANKGCRDALLSDPHLLAGLNVYHGKVTHQAVAESLGLNYTPAREVLQ